MSQSYLPSLAAVRAAFTESVMQTGGIVSDVFEDTRRLYIRSVSETNTAEIKPGDRVRSGVALFASGTDIAVHPYIFRQVCKNGAIAPCVTGKRSIHRVTEACSAYEAGCVLDEVCAAVEESSEDCHFQDAVREFREAMHVQANLSLHILAMLSRFPKVMQATFVEMIEREFTSSPDRSRFALINTVTAVARETDDPEVRWNLEELGGGMLIRRPEKPPVLGPQQRHRQRAGKETEAETLVGV